MHTSVRVALLFLVQQLLHTALRDGRSCVERTGQTVTSEEPVARGRSFVRTVPSDWRLEASWRCQVSHEALLTLPHYLGGHGRRPPRVVQKP